MRIFALSLILVIGMGMAPTHASGPNVDPVFEPCDVSVKERAEIPAQKDGTLIELPVIEGSVVKKGDVLAVIDDREAKAAYKVAEKGLRAAEERANDDIEERYAKAAADVAEVEWKMDLEANRGVPNAVSEIEILQKELVVKKSRLQIEKAQKDQKLAALDADSKEAELEAAQVALAKRTIRAPFDGEVVEMKREKSEWVNPGDTILTLMRFDTLYVEARVNARDWDRNELQGRPVTVTIPRAHGREIQLPGKVVHVSQVLVLRGQYAVRAEVENTKEGNSWVVQPGPGQSARMTIHLHGETVAAD